jgi:excisionase family DNA binding protein
MLIEDEVEKDLQALEALLGDKVAFTVGETAKILGRSGRWVLQKTASGRLASAKIGAQRRITRVTILKALTQGVEI